MGPAKNIARGVLELLATGEIIARLGGGIYKDGPSHCRASVSFLFEARKVYEAMYAKFPVMTEAFDYYESICRDICVKNSLSLEEVLKEHASSV